ncbi:hypothetical protein VDGL01_10110 [Verticillium dahliae]
MAIPFQTGCLLYTATARLRCKIARPDTGLQGITPNSLPGLGSSHCRLSVSDSRHRSCGSDDMDSQSPPTACRQIAASWISRPRIGDEDPQHGNLLLPSAVLRHVAGDVAFGKQRLLDATRLTMSTTALMTGNKGSGGKGFVIGVHTVP